MRKINKFIVTAVTILTLFTAPVHAAGNVAGGWSATTDTTVTEQTREIFDQAMEGLLGVSYEPVDLLATQVVAGTNYCFLCRSSVVAPDAKPGYCLVYVYENLKGEAELLGIKDLEFGEGILEDMEDEAEQAESEGRSF